MPKVNCARKGIIFDLDGTLWDTSAQVAQAWDWLLAEREDVDLRVDRETICGIMGKTSEEIAHSLFPSLEEGHALEIMEALCEEELVWLKKCGGGHLYKGVERTLSTLNQSYDLFIVSNCQEGYIETFLECHQLERYFADWECSGRTRKSKGENIQSVIRRNALEWAVYVGDTQGDYVAALYAEIPFIFAAYGFGTVDVKTNRIKALDGLAELIQAL